MSKPILMTFPFITDNDRLRDISTRLRVQYAQEGGDPQSATAEYLAIAEELLLRRTDNWPPKAISWTVKEDA